MTILLVDDDEKILKILKYKLEKNNYQVTPCINGKDALAKIEKGKIDLVIIDYYLPDLSGIEVIKSIKAIQSNMPAILLTAKNINELETVINNNLEITVIQKPVNKETLMTCIRQKLNQF